MVAILSRVKRLFTSGNGDCQGEVLSTSVAEENTLYGVLQKDSLHTTSMDHGLQYNAIYWEMGHRTWLSFFQPFCHKFTTKLIDDQIRSWFGWRISTADTSFIFYDDQQRVRCYEGEVVDTVRETF